MVAGGHSATAREVSTMKWVVRGNGDVHEVDVEPDGNGYSVVIDGRHHPVELVCLDGAVASLRYPADGRSFQVTFRTGVHGKLTTTNVSRRKADIDGVRASITNIRAIQKKSKTSTI